YVNTAVQKGLRPPVDRARSDADVARAEAGRLRAESALQTARAVLAVTIGSNELAVDAANVSEEEPAAVSFEQLWPRVEQHEPQLAAARLRVDVAREETALQRSQLWPTLSLTGSLTTRGVWQPTIPNYDAGLVLSWNAFDYVTIARMQTLREREAVASA